MSFSKVLVIQGYPITSDDFFRLCKDFLLEDHNVDIDDLDSEDRDSFLRSFEEEMFEYFEETYKLSVYGHTCCSKLNRKIYIIGKLVDTHERIRKHCDNCTFLGYGRFDLCKSCLGMTKDGVFEVEKIFNNVVEVERLLDLKNTKLASLNAKMVEFFGVDQMKRFKEFLEEDELDVPFNLSTFLRGRISSQYYLLDGCLQCEY